MGAEASAFELIEFFLGPLPEHRQGRDPHREAAQSEAAGMTVTDLRTARCRMEFFDVGADRLDSSQVHSGGCRTSPSPGTGASCCRPWTTSVTHGIAHSLIDRLERGPLGCG